MSQLKLTLKISTIACLKNQKANVEALGLKKVGESKIHNDTPVIRGMLRKVAHLITVEEINQ